MENGQERKVIVILFAIQMYIIIYYTETERNQIFFFIFLDSVEYFKILYMYIRLYICTYLYTLKFNRHQIIVIV